MRTFRPHPDLDQLKRQAKELLAAFQANEQEAAAEVNAHYSGADPTTFALHDAQLVLARAYGFDSWPKLKAYVDGMTVKRLAEFVQADDLAQARAMLQRRPELANMQMTYADERQCLHFAVMNRSPEMVRLLMQHGANARAGVHPHRDATNAFTLAVERGYDEIVAIIHEEEQRRTGPAPAGKVDELITAIGDDDEQRAIAMLDADPALVHARNNNGWTPLHIAAGVRHPALVRRLLECGADPNGRGREGRMPLDVAASGRCEIDPQRFATVVDILRAAGANMTARAAAALGDAGWLRARHDEGTLTNPLAWDWGGLLTVAVRHNQAAVLELLLDYGWDPDERVSYHEGENIVYSQTFPLYHCAELGREEMAEMLIRRGASMTAHVDSAGSPVHSAYSHRQWRMVELFRRHGAEAGPDTVAIYRQTEAARQMLARDKSPATVEMLLEFACSGGDPEIARMALEHIDWPRDDSRWVRYLGRCLDYWNHIPWLSVSNQELDRSTYIECLRHVLKRADPNLVGAFGRTTLHEAAAAGDHITEEEVAEIVRELLQAGAKTNMRDEMLKSTPLGWACRWGRPQMVRLLLAGGADPVEADAEPWATPRAWAVKMGYAEILKLLPA